MIHWPKVDINRHLSPLSSTYSLEKFQWTPGGDLYTFVDIVGPLQSDPTSVATSVAQSPVEGIILTKDTFRLQAIKVMNDIFYKYPF